MALAIDATSSGAATASSLTFAHTVGGTERILMVCVQESSTNVTGVTYDSVAMSMLSRKQDSNGDACSIWKLVNPNTGNHNIVITASGAEVIYGTGISLKGASGNLGTLVEASGSSTTPSVNATSNTGDIVIDSMVFQGNPVITVGAGQTQVTNDNSQTSQTGCASYESGAASVTMSWSSAGSAAWAIMAVAVKPSASGAPFLMSMV